jgi:hypothetical protein
MRKNARIWVKIPSLSNAAPKTIYMYYGKAGAISQSNGDQTFEFFDDFDKDLSKWDSRYCNLTTIASNFGTDSGTFNVPIGASSTVTTAVTIPAGVAPDREYEWSWELRWSNGALVEAPIIPQPFIRPV